MAEAILMMKKIFTHKVCNYIKNFICGNAGVNAHGVINIVLRSKFDERIQDSNIFVYLFHQEIFIGNT